MLKSDQFILSLRSQIIDIALINIRLLYIGNNMKIY